MKRAYRSQHFRFEPHENNHKLKWRRWTLLGYHDEYVGEIRYDRGWRTYAFVPAVGTVWSAGSMRAIASFVATETRLKDIL
jgi:hypothetical protein